MKCGYSSTCQLVHDIFVLLTTDTVFPDPHIFLTFQIANLEIFRCLCTYFCLSICLSLSVYLCLCLPVTHYFYVSVFLYTCSSVSLQDRLYVRPSIYCFVYSSLYWWISVCSSELQSIFLSVCLKISKSVFLLIKSIIYSTAVHSHAGYVVVKLVIVTEKKKMHRWFCKIIFKYSLIWTQNVFGVF